MCVCLTSSSTMLASWTIVMLLKILTVIFSVPSTCSTSPETQRAVHERSALYCKDIVSIILCKRPDGGETPSETVTWTFLSPRIIKSDMQKNSRSKILLNISNSSPHTTSCNGRSQLKFYSGWPESGESRWGLLLSYLRDFSAGWPAVRWVRCMGWPASESPCPSTGQCSLYREHKCQETTAEPKHNRRCIQGPASGWNN